MLETTATPNTPVPPPSARNWVKPLLMVTPYVVLYLIAIWLVAVFANFTALQRILDVRRRAKSG